MKDVGQRTAEMAALKHATPYIRLFKGKTFVVKVGGEAVETEAAIRGLLEQVHTLHQVGIPVVLVHGGLVALIAVGLLCGPRCWRALIARLHVRRLSRGEIAASDAAVLYARMLHILRRRGYDKPGWLTPAEFARILPPSPTSIVVANITSLYNQLRYGQQTDAGIRMIELLKELESA